MTSSDVDGEDLALGVVRNPLDRVRRLILADWYEEVGRDRDAHVLRQEGQVILLYSWVAYVTVSNDTAVLFRHQQGESIRCLRCKTGMKHGEGFTYLPYDVNGIAGWACTDCYRDVTGRVTDEW